MHFLSAVAAFATLSLHTAMAAECTDAEYDHDKQLWAAAAATTACAQYASGTTFFSWPCDATDCTAVLTEVAANMADCTVDGVSNKISLQNSLTTCNGGDTTDPGSPTTDAPSTTSPPATTAPSPAATASTTDCVTTEINNMVDLYSAAAMSAECADGSSVTPTSIVINAVCGSDCASKLEELATSLPNCYYGYQSENLKSDLLTQLDGCDGADDSYAINITLSPDNSTEAPSTTTPATSPPTPTSPPAKTTAAPSPTTNSTSKPTPAPTEGDSGTYC